MPQYLKIDSTNKEQETPPYLRKKEAPAPAKAKPRHAGDKAKKPK